MSRGECKNDMHVGTNNMEIKHIKSISIHHKY